MSRNKRKNVEPYKPENIREATVRDSIELPRVVAMLEMRGFTLRNGFYVRGYAGGFDEFHL